MPGKKKDYQFNQGRIIEEFGIQKLLIAYNTGRKICAFIVAKKKKVNDVRILQRWAWDFRKKRIPYCIAEIDETWLLWKIDETEDRRQYRMGVHQR